MGRQLIPGEALARALGAIAVCASLLAIVPSSVAGRGLPPLARQPSAFPSATAPPSAGGGGPIVVTASRVRQHGYTLGVRMRLASPLGGSDLKRGGRGLCLSLAGSAAPAELVCVRRGRHRGVRVVRASHRTRGYREPVLAHGRSLRVRLPFRPAHVRPGRLRYSIVTGDASCAPPHAGCARVFPGLQGRRLRVVRPRLIGCHRRGRSVVRGRSGSRRRVALTFDDGPGPSTPAVLRALRRSRVHATFFQLGKEVRGHGRRLRRMLAAGHMLADHSYSHPRLPSRSQLASTRSLIRRATGFETCLFRPPYGAVDGRLVHDAVRLGMTSVLWNVDPADYATPGVDAIVSRVLGQTRPGSIVIMHDGGGPRAQTAAAVPRIVHRLRRRGYRFVTVDRMLGYHRVYSPR